MILKGSQRSSALKLAVHLLNERDNDHVDVHELRGFSADDLRGALREADAIAKGTKCQQFLFSLSFNPPETERVSVDQFEAAIEKAEAALGLSGQARAIVFHEKEGRRHAHVVWSRIDVEKMTAIHMSFYKTRLNAVSKDLFLEHGWRLPDGYRDKTRRNPLSFTIDQWQQAKRTKQDPEAMKMIFRECWSVSDNRASFARALEEQGFILAQGKRGHVAVDFHGEVYAISRQTGEKAKAVCDKLGDAKDLPSVDQAKDLIASRMTDKLRGFIQDAEQQADEQARESERRKADLKARQRATRQELKTRQEMRAQAEALARSKRFRTGIRGMWDWLSGKTRKTRKQNELEAAEAAVRDAVERDRMIAAQLSERRVLQQNLRTTRRKRQQRSEDLRREVALYLGMRDAAADNDDSRPKDQRLRKSPRNQPEPGR
ncbi:relaxase/mobilization nuclease domain-containing protein [Salipiger thiooxidans]|uniref:relaxase/mobilization nuclease domain-containing protein n=1 Tax=Salipiger thiooxidans TaxID=282683 RepID=UPI001CD3063E|nr:relaxase/mobilization nuclease domain-containing protein [Salipiger thiooxidans]MCA0851345.1 relaxase/mobilization nuclease domain-containing protein [Salipiger thiooxidans]